MLSVATVRQLNASRTSLGHTAESRAGLRVVVSLLLLALVPLPASARAIIRTFKASDFEKALSLGVVGVDGVRITTGANGGTVYRLSIGKAELLELRLSPAAPAQNHRVQVRIAKFNFEWEGEVSAIGVFLPDALLPCGKGMMMPQLSFFGTAPSPEGLRLSFCTSDEVIGLDAAVVKHFGTVMSGPYTKPDSPDELHERMNRPRPPPFSTPPGVNIIEGFGKR